MCFCLSICLFIYLPIYLSVCLSTNVLIITFNQYFTFTLIVIEKNKVESMKNMPKHNTFNLSDMVSVETNERLSETSGNVCLSTLNVANSQICFSEVTSTNRKFRF